MQGIELARDYYETCGLPMLKEQFPEVMEKLAIAFIGSGSDRLGYDDETSQDHDFEPGFTILLPGEEVIDRRTAFLLERAYAKLPKEFRGYRRAPLSPVGGNRNGVMRLSDFLEEKTGFPDGELTQEAWLRIPEQYLLEVVSGCVFRDPSLLLTPVRDRLSAMPEDVRKKRLAGQLLLMGQAGQYNFTRCIAHGEAGAAQLALNEFVQATLHAVFLLNRSYMPYYKWAFRALRSLPEGGGIDGLEHRLLFLMTTPNDEAHVAEKCEVIESITGDIVFLIRSSGVASVAETETELERAAYAVNDAIADGNIRNLHILYCV